MEEIRILTIGTRLRLWWSNWHNRAQTTNGLYSAIIVYEEDIRPMEMEILGSQRALLQSSELPKLGDQEAVELQCCADARCRIAHGRELVEAAI